MKSNLNDLFWWKIIFFRASAWIYPSSLPDTGDSTAPTQSNCSTLPTFLSFSRCSIVYYSSDPDPLQETLIRIKVLKKIGIIYQIIRIYFFSLINVNNKLKITTTKIIFFIGLTFKYFTEKEAKNWNLFDVRAYGNCTLVTLL